MIINTGDDVQLAMPTFEAEAMVQSVKIFTEIICQRIQIHKIHKSKDLQNISAIRYTQLH